LREINEYNAKYVFLAIKLHYTVTKWP
jgi:hypothetical protein